MSKYRAKPVTVDGIRFASAKEAKRYGELKLLVRAGHITRLECQPVFPLIVNGTNCGKYIGDFSYFERDARVVEDVKSEPTKTPVYRLKRKIVLALNPGLDHREV